MRDSSSHLYVGLMSGTSLDGVDGVLASFSNDSHNLSLRTIAGSYVPFPADLRAELMALQTSGEDEIHREALAANALAHHYAQCVTQLLQDNALMAKNVCAIGAHGQTVRHRPELGYTRQTFNPALLAELTGIDVVADFRSRDIAAGGQGAPLVPAFHQTVFGKKQETRVVANIGGISNISVLTPEQDVIGFDTGPGNLLMDFWISKHYGKSYDASGAWAASGKVIENLLTALLSDPYFSLPPPKSTGRDLFHPAWLEEKLQSFPDACPTDVQATLCAFTAATLADSIKNHAPDAHVVYVCGGGAYNEHLIHELQRMLIKHAHSASVQLTGVLGIAPNHVEALAFAWLAQRHMDRQPGNLPSVTGARGQRLLGAHYPAC